MSDFEKQVIFELSKKYVFETFDFKNKTPEELLAYYQETSDKIEKVIDDQNSEIARHNAEMLDKVNFNF